MMDVTVGTVYIHTPIVKENKGVTLIALVVTITILLILAGISIAALTGENGLINRAANAKEQTEIAQEKEILQEASVNAMGKSKSGDVEKTYLDNELSRHSEIDSTKDVTDGIEVTFKSGRIYTVSADGDVTQKIPRIYSDEVKAALTEGKYVTYNGEKYMVLYDVTFDEENGTERGIEIVSENSLEAVILGYNDPEIPNSSEGYDFTGTNAQFEKARWSYNNAIITLNKYAQKYKTELAERARCLGSDPSNPLKENNDYIFTDNFIDKPIIKDEDSNSTIEDIGNPNKDLEQLQKIGGQGNGTTVWMSSRDWWDGGISGRSFFGVRICSWGSLGVEASLGKAGFIGVYSNGTKTTSEDATKGWGFRPVIQLKSNIKITGGYGTSASPYTISL